MRYFILGVLCGLVFVSFGIWIMLDPSMSSFCLGLLGMYVCWLGMMKLGSRITNPMYKPGDVVYIRKNPSQDISTLLAEARILNLRKGGRS